jgi:hypothetical protein
MRRAIEIAKIMYGKVRVEYDFDTTDIGLYKRLVAVVDSGAVNPLAGPGVPMCAFGSTNGDVLLNHRSLVLSLCMARLCLWRDSEISIYDVPPYELMIRGYNDAIRLFVKDEPHPVEKIEQGRFRLISSCSLIQQICERVVFTDCFNKQVANWYECPSMVGIGFTDPMTKTVWDVVSRMQRLAQTDVSGWDWSVFHELADAAAEVLCLINGTNHVHHKMIRVAIQCLMNAIFTTSDGELYSLDRPGVMKSGSFLTTMLNSLMRVLASVLASLEFDETNPGQFAISVGDDCVEQLCPGETLETRKANYARLGFRITDDRTIGAGEEFEFCSHLYRPDGRAELVTWPRCLYRLLNSTPSYEQLSQFKYELRHNSNLEVLLRFVESVGWVPPEIYSDGSNIVLQSQPLRLVSGNNLPPLVRIVTMSGRSAQTKPFWMSTLNGSVASTGAIVLQAKKQRKRKPKNLAAPPAAPAMPHGVERVKGTSKEITSDEPTTRFHAVLGSQDKALHDWLRTVMDPTSPEGVSGCPAMLGTFEVFTELYQDSLSGVAVADAAGLACLGVCVDSWIESGNATGTPDPATRVMGYTTAGVAALGSDGGGSGAAIPAAGSGFAGFIQYNLGKPDDNITAQTRIRTVAARLSVWSDEPLDSAKGEVMIVSSVNPAGPAEGGRINSATFGGLASMNRKVISRTTANIPGLIASGERLTAVALPAEEQAFEMVQWPAAGYTSTPIVTLAAFAKGMAAGQQLQFRVDYVFEAEATKSKLAVTPAMVPERVKVPVDRLNTAITASLPYSSGSTATRPSGIHALPFVEELAQSNPMALAAIDHSSSMRPVHQLAQTRPAQLTLYKPAGAQSGGILSTIKSIGSGLVQSGVLGAIPYVGPVVQGLASGLMKIFGGR